MRIIAGIAVVVRIWATLFTPAGPVEICHGCTITDDIDPMGDLAPDDGVIDDEPDPIGRKVGITEGPDPIPQGR